MAAIIIIAVIAVILVVVNIRVVQQARAFVIERLGAYKETWNVGLHVKMPFIDRVAKIVSLKEQVADFPPQPVITKDNVTMQIDTVVYFQITDPKLFTYGIEQPMVAIENLSATTLRNIIGDLELDQCLTSRDIINSKMRSILDEATDPWGIKVNRVELKNIHPSRRGREARRHSGGRRREGIRDPARRRQEAAADPGGRRRSPGHPEGPDRDCRRHPPDQRCRPLRRRAAHQGARGLCRRRERHRHQDHHPQRDPGPCRSGRGRDRGHQEVKNREIPADPLCRYFSL